jgi:UDP-2,3-diacylglucosamine pyrophosphatase LpxH
MLTYIRDEIKPDILFWTGDNSAHDVWKSSHQEIVDYTANITNTIKQIFNNTNVSVFPIEGNHDFYPVNV